MSGGRSAATGIARVIAACAVLAGLFFMHGLFTPSCHAAGDMPATATPMAATPAEPAAMTADAGHPLLAGVSMAHDRVSGQDSLCLSTPPPHPVNLADLLLALVALGTLTYLAFSLSFGRWIAPTRRHPPRLAGAALLTTLCISRT